MRSRSFYPLRTAIGAATSRPAPEWARNLVTPPASLSPIPVEIQAVGGTRVRAVVPGDTFIESVKVIGKYALAGWGLYLLLGPGKPRRRR